MSFLAFCLALLVATTVSTADKAFKSKPELRPSSENNAQEYDLIGIDGKKSNLNFIMSEFDRSILIVDSIRIIKAIPLSTGILVSDFRQRSVIVLQGTARVVSASPGETMPR